MKKIKKIFLVLFMSMMITGCSATYNLEYTSKGVKEELIINQEIEDLEYIKGSYTDYPVDYDVIVPDDDFSKLDKDTPLYEREFIKVADGYQIKYSYDKHNYKSIANSNAVKKGFVNASSVIYDGKRQLSTGKEIIAFKAYPELTDVTINITTDFEVLNNNADSVNGNTYTWHFTKDDKDKKINLLTSNTYPKIDDEENSESSNSVKKEEKNTSPMVLFIFLGVFVVVLILLFKFKK